MLKEKDMFFTPGEPCGIPLWWNSLQLPSARRRDAGRDHGMSALLPLPPPRPVPVSDPALSPPCLGSFSSLPRPCPNPASALSRPCPGPAPALSRPYPGRLPASSAALRVTAATGGSSGGTDPGVAGLRGSYRGHSRSGGASTAGNGTGGGGRGSPGVCCPCPGLFRCLARCQACPCACVTSDVDLLWLVLW